MENITFKQGLEMMSQQIQFSKFMNEYTRSLSENYDFDIELCHPIKDLMCESIDNSDSIFVAFPLHHISTF